ncbi:hypothetical protein [Lentzea roselyniae]|uniref:hypothetical protein n=1 Tax=Lentzea roselyniae TaxID=531940 RepID=UPI0031F9FEBF
MDELLGWCVAAETFHGEGGVEARSGLKHFAPGAKMWVCRRSGVMVGRTSSWWERTAALVGGWCGWSCRGCT